MAIFRTRALDAANRSTASDAPLLLPRPHRQRLRGNWLQLKHTLLPNRSARLARTQEQRQQDPTECGAVSLSIVLQHHGCHVPLSSLRRACGVSRDGSDAANLVRAAKLFGLEAKGFKKGLEALKKVSLPAILFWNFDHFLVLDGIEEGRYWVNDPASGRRCVELEEFDRCYTGVVLTMQPGPAFERTPAPPGAWKLLAKRLRHSPCSSLIALLVSCAAASAWLAALPSGAGLLAGWRLPSLLLALALPPLGQALSRQLQRRGSRQLQRQLLALPDWVLQQHFSAELSSRQRLLPQLSSFLNQHGWSTLPLVLAALLWGVALLPQQPAFALLLWTGVSLFGATNVWNERLQRSRDAQQRIAANKPVTVLQGSLQDPDTLKASALERAVFERWAGLEALATRARQRLAYSRDLQGWIPQLIGWSTPVLLIGLAWPGAQAGRGAAVALGVIALGLALIQQRGRAALIHWNKSAAALRSLQQLEEQPADPWLQDNAQPSPSKPPSGGAHLELEKVSFGYVPVLQPLLENITLQVQPGQRIAIVGGSASGKSTMARLMAGLLQPSSGVVRLNGHPLLEWPRQDRLRAIAMVQQGMPLLSCSVRDNLTFWNPAIPQAELEQACHSAAILERITRLPQGFDTPLMEAGQQLSGGEQQRLQIAQALLQQPSLLILDEATSALDACTEQDVEQALRNIGCTQIVVAHRLSTIRDADEILVLERGQLVQRGSHEAMAQCAGSAYQKLLQCESVSSRLNMETTRAQEN